MPRSHCFICKSGEWKNHSHGAGRAHRLACEVIAMTFALMGGDRRSVSLAGLLRADGHTVRPFALE